MEAHFYPIIKKFYKITYKLLYTNDLTFKFCYTIFQFKNEQYIHIKTISNKYEYI